MRVVCTTQTDASFFTKNNGMLDNVSRDADGHGHAQAAQITAGSSELRDITKMERIGRSHTPHTPL